MENKVRPTAFWKPHLLYLKPAPHDQLYVEVDAVAGCEPSAKELESLRAFLTQHCDKPGGVTVQLSSTIPKSQAKGLSRRELARGWMDGPPAGGRAPAYLYVLYFDGRLGADKKVARANPHAELLPYPAAIFINRGYRPFWARWMKSTLIQHEAGHILGLAQRADHASGGHCTEDGCLMQANINVHILRLLTGRDPVTQKQLCQHCREQLTTASKLPPAKNLSFTGPVLVREERGYRVLSLQGTTALAIGGGRAGAVSHLLEKERQRKTDPDENPNANIYYAWIDDSISKDKARLRTILDHASRDPYGLARQAARELREEVAR